MRHGGWSVSANSRFDGDGPNLFHNIDEAKRGGKTVVGRLCLLGARHGNVTVYKQPMHFTSRIINGWRRR